jgi:LysR family transcriptional regulator, regulator for metE and metH
MPVLDVRHLVMLEAISVSPTLAEAANRLNITPSALTHRLQEAERRLACPILTRSGRRPQLTDAGQRVLQAARICLRELEAAERESIGGGGAPRETVRLGASTLCGYDWLPGLLGRLQVTHPHIDVEVLMDISVDPLRALRDQRIDLAVLPVRVQGRGLTNLRLFQDEMVALVPTNHRMSGARFIGVEELAGDVYVADVTIPEAGREYERLFEPAGVRPARIVRAGHMAAVVGLVRAGLGVTICTRTSAAPFMPAAGLTILGLAPQGQFLTWHAILRSSRRRGAADRAVADALVDVVRGNA